MAKYYADQLIDNISCLLLSDFILDAARDSIRNEYINIFNENIGTTTDMIKKNLKFDGTNDELKFDLKYGTYKKWDNFDLDDLSMDFMLLLIPVEWDVNVLISEYMIDTTNNIIINYIIEIIDNEVNS